MSNKQKINTKCSVEIELAGINGAMHHVLWSQLFTEAQGLTINDNILLQDNERTIYMAKHGKKSCTEQTYQHLIILHMRQTEQR